MSVHSLNVVFFESLTFWFEALSSSIYMFWLTNFDYNQPMADHFGRHDILTRQPWTNFAIIASRVHKIEKWSMIKMLIDMNYDCGKSSIKRKFWAHNIVANWTCKSGDLKIVDGIEIKGSDLRFSLYDS